MRRLVVLLVLLLLGVAGCSAGTGGSDASGGTGVPGVVADEAAEGAPDSPSGGGEDTEDGGGAVGVVDSDDGRQVVTEGSVTLTVERPRLASRDAVLLVEQAGGHVQERVEQAGATATEDTAWLVVRIPSDGLSGVLQELERLGRVDSVELTSTDVTGQAQDLDARIRAMEISVARLEDLLSRAQSTADVVAAEASLTERQSELESMVSERNRLADRVAMSTVRLLFQSEEAAPPPARAGFGGGLATGWESLVAAFSTGLLVLGVVLPWALAAAVVVLGTVAVRRGVRRRVSPAPAASSESS